MDAAKLKMDFEGKCVIVTGSSKGIGRGIAVAFAQQGANVIIHGRDEDAINQTVAMCEDNARGGAKFPIVKGDLRENGTLEQLVDVARKEFGHIDVLVNNAGSSKYHDDSLISGPIATFDWTMDVKIRHVVLMSQLCFEDLKKSGGNIVNISGLWGYRPAPNPFYTISNAMINMFTQCAALEFGSQGVRVNALCPGFVKGTEFMKASGLAKSKEDEEHFEKVSANLAPTGKTCSVKDVADMVVFMASEKASMLNGAIVVQDGGTHLTGLDMKTLQNAAK